MKIDNHGRKIVGICQLHMNKIKCVNHFKEKNKIVSINMHMKCIFNILFRLCIDYYFIYILFFIHGDLLK